MTRYRRIEITAFRRRVTITSGAHTVYGTPGDEVVLGDGGSSETIEISSEEGQEILIEAIRLLEQRISETSRRETGQAPSPANDNY